MLEITCKSLLRSRGPAKTHRSASKINGTNIWRTISLLHVIQGAQVKQLFPIQQHHLHCASPLPEGTAKSLPICTLSILRTKVDDIAQWGADLRYQGLSMADQAMISLNQGGTGPCRA
jgi:hypothetical protein